VLVLALVGGRRRGKGAELIRDLAGGCLKACALLPPARSEKEAPQKTPTHTSPSTQPCKQTPPSHHPSRQEDFKDFINPVTKAEVAGLGDPALRNLKKGEVVQLERRGFYICDRPYLGADKPPVLFMIPDGKVKAMSTLSGALKHV
jgi:hypothetical protein